VARLRAGTATSAGGVVIRESSVGPSIVIGRRRRDRVGSTWSLPKGTPIEGETTEETALREVCEETGLTVAIVEPLQSIDYSFVREGARIQKTVHFFVMQPTGGDLADHDHEFEEVRWVSFDEAAALLTFSSERSLVELAASRRARAGSPST
jgi:8-oxo-dGTP pyrophosphatase MutT (NUDIX family)